MDKTESTVKPMFPKDAERYSKWLEIFKNDQNAIHLLNDCSFVSNLWDDLIDKDNPRTDEDINKAFWLAIIGIPSNPLVRVHFDQIMPLLNGAVLNFIAANELEEGNERERGIAHIGRYALSDVFIMVAQIIGGFEWAAKHSATIKSLIHDDTLGVYLEEMEQKNGS